MTTVGCPTRPGPRQRSAARAVRVASIGIGHEADTPEALIAVNPSRPGRIYRDWSRCRHARSTDGGQPVNKLKFGSVGSRVGGHPLSPRHNVEVAPRRQKLDRPSVVAWSTLFRGVRGLQQWPKTELKFVDGWMSHRHVGHMTLMPQPTSQHRRHVGSSVGDCLPQSWYRHNEHGSFHSVQPGKDCREGRRESAAE